MIVKQDLRKLNLKNLLLISNKFKKYHCFVFYGTLLGLTRENNIIRNDDDIDFLIDIKYKKKIIHEIKKLRLFKINKKNINPYFIQLTRKFKNIKTFVDLYFYLNLPNKSYIEEKHNWLSFINSPKHSLFIPKNLIFPLKKNKKFPDVYFPNNKKNICRFLYGPDWKRPLIKNSGYRMEIINNKPKLIKRSFLGKITRSFKNLINNKFIKN